MTILQFHDFKKSHSYICLFSSQTLVWEKSLDFVKFKNLEPVCSTRVKKIHRKWDARDADHWITNKRTLPTFFSTKRKPMPTTSSSCRTKSKFFSQKRWKNICSEFLNEILTCCCCIKTAKFKIDFFFFRDFFYFFCFSEVMDP